jgi:hypothetical protein
VCNTKSIAPKFNLDSKMVRRRCGNGEDVKKTQKERKVNAPQRLPRHRPRALTGPLCDNLDRWSLSWIPFMRSRQQQTSSQSQSSLLARLPVEVRQLVWREVIGGHVLHVARAHKRLLAINCAEHYSSKLPTRYHGCWGSTSGWIQLGTTPGFYLSARGGHSAKPANLLPLLQTCRTIYSETISMLYRDNVFDINHVDTLLYLRQSVLPDRLGQIRTLNLIWDFKWPLRICSAPYDVATWREACRVLAGCTGLQELSIFLSGGDLMPGLDKKERWQPLLEPLMLIKAARSFFVFLPWPEDVCAEVAKDGDYPFQLAPITFHP